MKAELKKYLDVAKAISALLHPFAEVVLHDLEKDQIEAIFNPFSQRKVGDSSYLDKVDFDAGGKSLSVVGPYEKTNYDSRKLKSISTIIKNDAGEAVGFLCINLDISVFDKYQNMLSMFLSNNDRNTKQAQNLFKDDLFEQISIFVKDYCLENNLNMDALSRDQKKTLIMKLEQEGALAGKNASEYIARILGVSRATVYNYLK